MAHPGDPQKRTSKTIALTLAVTVWGLTAFALFMVLFFPFPALIDYFMEQYSQKLLIDIEFEKLSPTGINRIEAQGLTISRKNDPDSRLAKVDRIGIDFKWTELFNNVLDLKMDADLLGGTAEGTALLKGENLALDFRADNLQLGALPAAQVWLADFKKQGIKIENLRGRISGSAKGNMPINNPIQYKGMVSIIGKDITADHGFSIMTGSDEFRLDTLNINALLAQSQIRFRDTSAKGPDLEANLTGVVKMVINFRASLSDLQLKLDFKGKLKDNLSPIMDIKSASGRKIQKKGNTYTLLIRGPLAKALDF